MLTITTNSFENDVLRADKPVLVDFWAQWCPYCRRIAPAFDKVGEQYADTLIAGKINYDEEPQLIERFGIDTIPTLMLFKNGEVLGPAPLPVVRMNNRYRYRVTLYCNQSKAVRRAAANIVMYCNTEKSFRDVTVFADDNPLD